MCDIELVRFQGIACSVAALPPTPQILPVLTNSTTIITFSYSEILDRKK